MRLILPRKSQIAIEFSHRQREKYPSRWIFWVHASTRDRFLQAYQEIAEVVKIPNRNEPGADILLLVRCWLNDENNGSWLMVLDNADVNGLFFRTEGETRQEHDAARQDHPLSFYVPNSSHGGILITSRNQVGSDLVGPCGYVEKVSQFNKETAVQLVRKK